MRKKLKNHANTIILTIIILLGSLLRIININNNPARLTHDAMSIGYNAYSIFKTGKDEWGRFMPLDFEAFGDHKLPGAIYAAVPSIALFGLKTLGLVMPSILAGTVLIVLMYLLVKELTQKKHLGLFAAFITATSPWTIRISRMMFESNLALTIYTGALFLLVKSLKKKQNLYYLLGASFLLGLSFYFYIAFRLISTLTLGSFLLYAFINKYNKKDLFISLLVFIVSISPLIPQLFSTGGTARFNQVSVFNSTGYTSAQQEITDYCFMKNPASAKFCRKLFSKPVLIVKNIKHIYTEFLVPSFLFTEKNQISYLQNTAFGLFFVVLSPLLLLGLFNLKKQSSISKILLIFLLIVAPLPTALTGEIQIIRASAYIIPVVILFSFGWEQALSLYKKKQILTSGLITIYCCWLLLFVIHDHLVYAPKSALAVYQLPPQLALDLKARSDIEQIYFTKHYPDAHIALAFYQQIDPQWYQNNIVRPEPDNLGFTHADKLGKYQFGDLPLSAFLCNKENHNNNFIYITHDSEVGLPATQKYKGFSNVHTHAYVYDSQKMRKELTEQQLATFCQKH